MPIRRLLKRQLGREFYRCRKNLSLGLEAVADQTGYSWQKIDKIEIGQTQNWDIYNKMLNFYNKRICLTLVDPDNSAGNRGENNGFLLCDSSRSALPDDNNNPKPLLREDEEQAPPRPTRHDEKPTDQT